jgi:glutamate-1-semialdehyde 2,1-aminomutase
VWDIEGREYVDLVMGFGSMLVGHRHPAVEGAMAEQLTRGTSFGTACPTEVELAETIVERVPEVERLGFTNSGTEATQAAIRLARRATGRPLVAKFEGGWHGWHDSLMVSEYSVGGPLEAPRSMPEGGGIPPGIADAVLTLPFNHAAAAGLIAEHADRLAAVIVEPVQGAGGCIPADRGWLEGVREVTRRTDVLLILDEVITGFRLAPDGGAGYYGVAPDIVTLGKVIGGGTPSAAVAGTAEVFSVIGQAPSPTLFGTMAANPLSMAAGLATLAQLDSDEPYAVLQRHADRTSAALHDLVREHGIEATITHVPGLFGLHFVPDVTNIRDLTDEGSRLGEVLSGRLIEDGFLVSSPFHEAFFSIAHTDDDIDELIGALERAIHRMVLDGEFERAA